MSAQIWDTRGPADPAFKCDWEVVLANAPHANFTLRADYLLWEAAHGRHALAALVGDVGRRGALVLRREGRGLVCGQPWRWQAVIEDARRNGPTGLDEDDASWLLERAQEIAGRVRLRCFFPVAPPARTPGYHVYTTQLYSIAHSDEELLRAMHPSKRRMIRRAEREGYGVVEGRELEHLRAFARILREVGMRRGLEQQSDSESLPSAGEGWREWENPWMWLLLAQKGGRVESGLGDAVHPGGTMDGRKAGTTTDGRRAGAFALLSFEEARRGRDRGFRWINLGGDTLFKREFTGALGHRVPMHCWMGRGAAWGIPDQAEILWHGARAAAATLARRLRGARAAETAGPR